MKSAVEFPPFSPRSRAAFTPVLKANQRYRHHYNDLRLSRGVDNLVDRMVKNKSTVIAQCANDGNELESMYRLLSNESVELPELISHLTTIDPATIAGREVYAMLDNCSCNLKIGQTSRLEWADNYGVIEDNRSPGFSIMPSLIVDAERPCSYGLGDVLFNVRQKAPEDEEELKAARKVRNLLPFDQKESSIWLKVACNTAKQLEAARKVTFIMDQGSDHYELWRQLLAQTGRDFISRIKNDRKAVDLNSGQYGKLSELLDSCDNEDRREVKIKKLSHRSKSSGKMVRRKKRNATLCLRYLKIQLSAPDDYDKQAPGIEQPLYYVEVREHASSVPKGEKPIHWRLLTSWPLENAEQAWQVAVAYQGRWDIEQLFRILKKDGLKIERSQLDKPERIEKLTMMALKAASRISKLVAARDGKEFIDIHTEFTQQEVEALKVMNKKYEGATDNQRNHHDPASLAWAVWVIARAGGWKGAASEHKPGPETMMRGVEKLAIYVECLEMINGT